MKARSAGLDALRTVGIVAIIAGHVWDSPLIRASIYTWHVPLFFLLTGYLWTRGRSLHEEARNRWRTVGLPYAAWLAVIAFPFLITVALSGDGTVGTAARILAGGAYIGRPFSAFWFMTALVIACLLFRWLERFHPAVVWAVALAGVAACTVAPRVISKAPFAAGVAVAALLFLLVGQLLKQHRDRIRRPIVAASVLLAGAAVLVATGVAAPLDMKQADLGTPGISMLVACAICSALILIAETIFRGHSGTFSTVIIELALVGTAVVLSHAAVLWILGTPKNGSWLDFGLTLCVAWGVAFVVARSPLSQVFAGIPRRPFPQRRRSLED